MVGAGGAGAGGQGGNETKKKSSSGGRRRQMPRGAKNPHVEGSESSKAHAVFERERERRRAFGAGDATTIGLESVMSQDGKTYRKYDRNGNLLGIFEVDPDDDFRPRPWGPTTPR